MEALVIVIPLTLSSVTGEPHHGESPSLTLSPSLLPELCRKEDLGPTSLCGGQDSWKPGCGIRSVP